MTLPASVFRDPSVVADENIQREKREAELKQKLAERHRVFQSRKHRMQLKKLMDKGGMK